MASRFARSAEKSSAPEASIAPQRPGPKAGAEAAGGSGQSRRGRAGAPRGGVAGGVAGGVSGVAGGVAGGLWRQLRVAPVVHRERVNVHAGAGDAAATSSCHLETIFAEWAESLYDSDPKLTLEKALQASSGKKAAPRFSQGKTYTLATISIVQAHDAQYVREWVEYHTLLGVEHFYLLVDACSSASVLEWEAPTPPEDNKPVNDEADALRTLAPHERAFASVKKFVDAGVATVYLDHSCQLLGNGLDGQRELLQLAHAKSETAPKRNFAEAPRDGHAGSRAPLRHP